MIHSTIPARLFGALLLTALGAAQSAAQTDRLDVIRARGALHCGAPTEPRLGFAYVGDDGAGTGFGLDFCRALATAIIGRPGAVRFRPIDSARVFLQSADIDIVLHALTFDVARNAGFAFGPVIFHDGQTLLVRAESGVGRAADLRRASICAVTQGPARANLAASAASLGVEWTIRASGTRNVAHTSFVDGACDVLSDDASALFSLAAGLAGRFAILPERLTTEPLAPVLRQGDERLLAVLRWVVYATIEAERLGLDAGNIDDPPEAMRASAALLVNQGEPRAAGLAADWVSRVIKAVGNYGQIYARNLTASNVDWTRGRNELSSNGGLITVIPGR